MYNNEFNITLKTNYLDIYVSNWEKYVYSQ